MGLTPKASRWIQAPCRLGKCGPIGPLHILLISAQLTLTHSPIKAPGTESTSDTLDRPRAPVLSQRPRISRPNAGSPHAHRTSLRTQAISSHPVQAANLSPRRPALEYKCSSPRALMQEWVSVRKAVAATGLILVPCWGFLSCRKLSSRERVLMLHYSPWEAVASD